MTTVTDPAGPGPLPVAAGPGPGAPAGYGAATGTPGSPRAAGSAHPEIPAHPDHAVGAAVPGWDIARGGHGSPGHPDPSAYPYGYPAGAYPPPYVLAPPGRFTAFMLRLWERSPRWLAPAAILACFAGAAGYVLVSDPTDDGADAVSTCLVKLTTGFDCPGCGGTRAFYYLLRGNVPAAARHHLVFVFAVPFLIYLYAAWAGRQVFRRTLPELRLPPITMAAFLAAWMVFSVLRNLPFAPFNWLYV